MTPHCCPVCHGRGTLPAGFYSSGSSTSVTVAPETCRSCKGEGVLWSAQPAAVPVPVPYPAYPVPYWTPGPSWPTYPNWTITGGSIESTAGSTIYTTRFEVTGNADGDAVAVGAEIGREFMSAVRQLANA